MNDIRYALRKLRRDWMLSGATVLTLGVGLGATAAIFAAYRAAMVLPAPYSQPDELVHIWEVRAPTGERTPTSLRTLVDWGAGVRTLVAVEGYNPSNVAVGFGSGSRMLRGAQVTPGFFRVLGVPMAAGSDFAAREPSGADGPVAVISGRLAREVGSEGPVGGTIRVNGVTHTVIGVLPDGFHFAPLQDADIWQPLPSNGPGADDRSIRGIGVVGRLVEAGLRDTAQGEVAAVMSELGRSDPEAMAGRTGLVLPLRDALLGRVKSVMLALLVAVGLLLGAMTVTLALLMIARSTGRAPELAVRTALGATGARQLRHLLPEALLLATLGGALGVVVGRFGLDLLLRTIPEGVRIDMPYLSDAAVDPWIATALVGTSIVLTLGFGLGPSLGGRGRGLHPGRTGRFRAGRGARRKLLVAQIALTVTLVTSACFLAVSLLSLVAPSHRFADPDELVMARVSLSGARYAEADTRRGFFEELLEGAAGLPGVRAVAAISEEPGGGGRITTVDLVDEPTPAAERPRTALRIVAGDYFMTAGIPVLEGHVPFPTGQAGAVPTAVVSARMARQLPVQGSVVGRRIRIEAAGDEEWEVVGVVADVPITALDSEPLPAVYVPHRHLAENRMSLVLRTGRGPAGTAPEVRALVGRIDPEVPLYAVGSLERKLRDSRAVFTRRFPMTLTAAFGLATLILALVSLYAVTTSEVFARRRELAIRAAVGARPGDIVGTVLRESLVTGVLGVASGVVLAFVTSRTLAGLLFGVSAADWRIYGAVSAAVLALAVAASWLPARRAARLDPIAALRHE